MGGSVVRAIIETATRAMPSGAPGAGKGFSDVQHDAQQEHDLQHGKHYIEQCEDKLHVLYEPLPLALVEERGLVFGLLLVLAQNLDGGR